MNNDNKEQNSKNVLTRQTAETIREELYTLEGFVQLGLHLPYGPFVLFKRLAHRYPRHFIQFMNGHYYGTAPGAPGTIHGHLPIAITEEAGLSQTLEHYLTHPPRTDEEQEAFQRAADALENRLWMGTFHEPHFTHFLDLDQYTDDPEGLGIESLFYHLDGRTLHIRLTEREGRELGAQSVPVGEARGVKEVLSAFLLHYCSQPGNRSGDNEYLWSNLISRAEWEELSRLGRAAILARQEDARKIAEDNELIDYCRQQGLNPRPEGSNETNWYANCPSRGAHPIMISSHVNQWGCGYCRKKGGLQELKEWMEKRRRQT